MDIAALIDSEGFLYDLNDWNEEIALQLAAGESIVLGKEHWDVLWATRSFFKEFDQSPSMRLLVKWLKQQQLSELASSIKLMTLFGESPARMASLLAGLPKPDNCL